MEHLDVLVVGAGLSGVAAGHYLQTECPWATYAIFEARPCLGGTWDLFRFPGVRSDSDLYTFGYPFRPWTDHRAIADGASILRYIEDTAAAEGIDAKIRFRHRVVAANWSTAEARWHVTAERTDTGDDRRAHVLVPVRLHRVLPLRPRLPTGLPRRRSVRRSHRAPAGLARRPRLHRSAGGGGRQRRDSGDDRAGPRAGRPPRHDAAALAVVRPDRADEVTDRPHRARRRPGALDRGGAQVDVRHDDPGLLQAQSAPAGRGEADAPQGHGEAAAHRATTSTPTSRRATGRGTSACASRPTAICSAPSGRAGPTSSPTASTPSPSAASAWRRAVSSTPTSSSRPRASSCSSPAVRSSASTGPRSTSRRG